MAFKSSVNLGLPNIAEPPDIAFFGEFTRVYNAIRNLAIALDAYTGTLAADASLYTVTGSSAILLQNLTRLYVPFGVAIAAGQVVHLYNNAGVLTAELATAVAGVKPMHGWCSIAAGAGAYGEVMLQGKCDLIGGLTPGATYYLADAAGAISNAPGTTTQRIGFALDAASLFVNPTLV